VIGFLVVVFAALDASAEFYRGTDLERDGKDAEAAAVFAKIVADTPSDSFADDALFELARLEEEKLADPVGAARDYRRLALDYPDSRLAVRAERRAEALGRELGPTGQAAAAAAEWGKIFYGFSARPRPETIHLVEDFLARHPDYPDAAQAVYWLATLLDGEGRSREALSRLRDVETRFPSSEWAPRAHTKEGDLLLDAGDLDGAAAAYRAGGASEGQRRVAVWRWRARATAAAWIVIAAAALAGLFAVRRAAGSFKPLLRAPLELVFLLPVAGLFAAAALTENAVLGHAVELICVGGLAAAWLSGAALDAQRARGPITLRRVGAHVALTSLAILAVGYIAVTREKLVDQLVETVRFGAER
jgi:tetratricopeptide (TPR) repeat protein